MREWLFYQKYAWLKRNSLWKAVRFTNHKIIFLSHYLSKILHIIISPVLADTTLNGKSNLLVT